LANAEKKKIAALDKKIAAAMVMGKGYMAKVTRLMQEQQTLRM
jgi:hypothetical protein